MEKAATKMPYAGLPTFLGQDLSELCKALDISNHDCSLEVCDDGLKGVAGSSKVPSNCCVKGMIPWRGREKGRWRMLYLRDHSDPLIEREQSPKVHAAPNSYIEVDDQWESGKNLPHWTNKHPPNPPASAKGYMNAFQNVCMHDFLHPTNIGLKRTTLPGGWGVLFFSRFCFFPIFLVGASQ